MTKFCTLYLVLIVKYYMLILTVKEGVKFSATSLTILYISWCLLNTTLTLYIVITALSY